MSGKSGHELNIKPIYLINYAYIIIIDNSDKIINVKTI